MPSLKENFFYFLFLLFTFLITKFTLFFIFFPSVALFLLVFMFIGYSVSCKKQMGSFLFLSYTVGIYRITPQWLLEN